MVSYGLLKERYWLERCFIKTGLLLCEVEGLTGLSQLLELGLRLAKVRLRFVWSVVRQKRRTSTLTKCNTNGWVQLIQRLLNWFVLLRADWNMPLCSLITKFSVTMGTLDIWIVCSAIYQCWKCLVISIVYWLIQIIVSIPWISHWG